MKSKDSTTSLTTNNINDNNNHNFLLQLPLIHHNTLLERHHRELSSISSSLSSPSRNNERVLKHKSGKSNKHNSSNSNNNNDNDKLSFINSSPIYQGYGAYYVDLWIGTPKPQRQTVLVDTGSSVTAFPCRSGCPNYKLSPSPSSLSSTNNEIIGNDKNNDHVDYYNEGDEHFDDSKESCGGGYHVDDTFDESSSSTFQRTSCTNDKICHGNCKIVNINDDNDDSNNNINNNNNNNNTNQQEICHKEVSYEEGSSWEAYYAVDEVSLGGHHNDGRSFDGNLPFRFPLSFGCQYNLTEQFIQQLADGIMGMSNEKDSFWMQMYDRWDEIRHSDDNKTNSNIITKPQHTQSKSTKCFSLCLYNNSTIYRNGSSAGVMTIGGSDPKGLQHLTPMIYAKSPLKKKRYDSYHYVEIRQVYLLHGGFYNVADANAKTTTRVELKGEKDGGKNPWDDVSVIVDSGSTATYLHHGARDGFREAWRSLIGHDYDKSIDDDDLQNIPSILVQLHGVPTNGGGHNDDIDIDNIVPVGLAGDFDVEHPNDVLIIIYPQDYIGRDPKDGRLYTTGVDVSSGETTVTLGSNFMSGKDILFDAFLNKRMGFAFSNCGANEDTHDIIDDDADSDANDYNINNKNKTGSSNILSIADSPLSRQATIATVVIACLVIPLTFFLYKRQRKKRKRKGYKPLIWNWDQLRNRNRNRIWDGVNEVSDLEIVTIDAYMDEPEII